MHAQPPIRIIFADKHPVFRDGFKSIVKKEKEIQLVSEAANGKELCSLVEKHLPDIVITDISLLEMDGIQASRIIKKTFPAIGIIGFSEQNEAGTVKAMLEAGASSYLLKSAAKKEIVDAIKTVYKGDFFETDTTAHYFSNQLTNKRSENKIPLISFTTRELQIIKLICKEYSTKEMASQLSLSERTVEDHRKHIQRKTGAKNMVGIAVYAIRHRLFEVFH